jgi:chromate transporter
MINPVLYFLFFLKATLFSTGSFGNMPSLHQDLIGQSWATESEFAQAISIGQLSPGPNGLWVISLGYFTYGEWGAIIALLAITLPSLIVLLLDAGYTYIKDQYWMNAMMRGVSLATVGMLLAIAWSITDQPGVDWRVWLIGAGALALAASRRVHVLVILGLAGMAGYLIYR